MVQKGSNGRAERSWRLEWPKSSRSGPAIDFVGGARKRGEFQLAQLHSASNGVVPCVCSQNEFSMAQTLCRTDPAQSENGEGGDRGLRTGAEFQWCGFRNDSALAV